MLPLNAALFLSAIIFAIGAAGVLTRGALDARAWRLAHRLRELGVGHVAQHTAGRGQPGGARERR